MTWTTTTPTTTIALASIVTLLAISVATGKKFSMMGVFSKLHSAYTRAAFGVEQKVTKSHFYELADKLIDGTPVTMKTYEGDVLCIVNVASK